VGAEPAAILLVMTPVLAQMIFSQASLRTSERAAIETGS